MLTRSGSSGGRLKYMINIHAVTGVQLSHKNDEAQSGYGSREVSEKKTKTAPQPSPFRREGEETRRDETWKG